jgi:hypothetical protein
MATDITTDRLRELAETRLAEGKILSLYINLDPREFATPPARATEVNSVLDSADRTLRERNGLTHDEKVALREDIERVRERFRQGMDTEGARGLAVFVSGPADLFEVLKLPRPVEPKVCISESPAVEEIARIGAGEPWWIVLADRRRARLLSGTIDGLVELWRVDDETRNKHDQGGWSQSRYQRSIDKDAGDHLRNVDHELQQRVRGMKISGILLGGPAETTSQLEGLLHPDVARGVKGRFDAAVWNTTADEVLAAARETLEEQIVRRDDAWFARLEEALATNGRAAERLADVLLALHERRVETLLVEAGFTAAGVRCPQCGWMGITTRPQCPADGTMTEAVDNIVDVAIECAFAQDARVHVHQPDERLERHGSIAALLRF